MCVWRGLRIDVTHRRCPHLNPGPLTVVVTSDVLTPVLPDVYVYDLATNKPLCRQGQTM